MFSPYGRPNITTETQNLFCLFSWVRCSCPQGITPMQCSGSSLAVLRGFEVVLEIKSGSPQCKARCSTHPSLWHQHGV